MKNRGYNSPRKQSGKVAGGLVLVVIGVLLLAAKTGVFFFPHWVFTWQMFLIVLGLFLGFKHSFQKPGWLVLVVIGSVFLLDDHFFFDFSLRRFFWPILIIGLGLWLMLRPRKRHPWDNQVGAGPAPAVDETTGYYTDPNTGAYAGGYTDYTGTYTSEAHAASPEPAAYVEDYVESTAIFGGIKKNIITKNFKGGEVVSVFGGTELNLMQADMQHPVVLEATQIFGGTTLIVPPHWQIKSEMVAILGGIDDKRPALPHGYDPNKVLILKGTTLFGGLNIKSY
ncbi:LiaF transmembrane domain-containing protein [Pontibacter sp. HJ8]